MPATGSNSFTNYRLSIRLGADGFSFSVGSTLDGSVVQEDRFPVTDPAAMADVLRQALRKPYLMDYRFQSVELVTEGPSTIVPLEHFNKSDMLAFYRLCFPSATSQGSMANLQSSMFNVQCSIFNVQCSMADMQYQILSPVEAVMLFRLDQSLLRIVQECYPDVKACCADAQELERIAAMQEKRPAPEDVQQHDVYLHVAEHSFFVAVFARSKLLYAASQPAANDADRIFLLLGIWKALDLNPQRDVLHLEGASRELQKTLAEYILNIE
ncbi:MAG: DUF3822 family protein [Bacteroidaceae bacterium]|nr:DUF3822 family protein [Bacteroidaceae bacterium]